MTLKHRFLSTFFVLLALNITGTVRAQKIMRVTPPNIEFRGVSMGDHLHSMCVGDSASIVLNTTTNNQNWSGWTSRSLSSPCDKSHTFYGVSFYSTTRAAIVGDAGLIFLTTNQGSSWIQSGVGITNQTLRAITRASTALIVVGDSGIVLQSIDSGKTWNRVASSTTRNINALSINASGVGYFVGEHGLIGKTTDFGATWPIVTDTSAFGYRASSPVTLRGVAISNHDSVVAVGDSGAVGISVNGIRWTAVKPAQVNPLFDSLIDTLFKRVSFRGISYSPYVGSYGHWTLFSESDLLCGMDGGSVNVSRSYALAGDADGGTDFIAWRYDCGTARDSTTQAAGAFESLFMNNSPLSSIFQTFLFASIDSLGNGYSTGTGGLFFKTIDSGYSWSQLFTNDQNTFDATDIYTIDSNNVFAVGWSGNLFRTTNGGSTWDSTNIAAAGQERLHRIAHPASGVYVVCGDFGTIIRSTDGTVTWNASVVPTTNYLESIAFSSPEIGISVGTSGTIIRTTDQGVTWTNVNNQLTGSNVSFRQVAAFPSGTYYATTDSMGLWQSTDQGQNWSQISDIPSTISMGFYNEKIGVVAEAAWSSAIVNDTMRFAFTRDGFATKPTEWTMPIVSNNRMVFHFLDSNTFLCFGSDGFVVKVGMSSGSASVTELSSPRTSLLRAFPNPSATHSTTIEYDLTNSGPTTIELWNSLGEKMQTLFEGTEAMGHHARQLTINPELHGSYFVKVISGTETKTVPIVVE